MTGDEAALLATLPAWAFAFVLVMARIGAAIALLPGLGEAEPPAMVRVGLCLGGDRAAAAGHRAIDPAGAGSRDCRPAFMVAAEVITGLWIGWLARLLVLALPIAGQFIAYMLGIANVLQPDPGTRRPGDADRAAVRHRRTARHPGRPASMRCRWPHSPAAIS